MNQLELVDVMTYHCLPCLRDLLQITDFENTYLRWVSSSWHYDVEGVKWAVENSDVVPTHQLLDTYLSLLDDDADLPLVQLNIEMDLSPEHSRLGETEQLWCSFALTTM